MGFEGLLFVPGQNNGVGLALFWKIKHMAKVPAYSKNFIDVDVDLFQKKKLKEKHKTFVKQSHESILSDIFFTCVIYFLL